MLGMNKKNKTSNIKNCDVDKLYQQAPSLSDWLPWLDYDETSQTFTLEDGMSAAAYFEIIGVSTEGRTEAFLQEVQMNIQTCINHSIPAHDNPYVLQCFVNDEDSLSSFSQSVYDYVPQYTDAPDHNKNLTTHFLGEMQKHYQRVTKKDGLFEDNAVAGSTWSGKIRRVRVCLYRRVGKNENSLADPVTELNQVAERFTVQLQAAGIRITRATLDEFFAWLLRWFNPKADITEGDQDALAELMTLPDEQERLPNQDLTQLLFLSKPESDAKNGVWWFDDIPHRCINVDGLRRKPAGGHFTGERKIGENLYALFDKFPAGTVLSITITIQPQDLVENQIIQVLNASKGETAEAMAAESDAKEALTMMSHGDYLLPTVITVFVKGDSLIELKDNVNATNALLLANGLHPIREKDDLIPLDTYIRQLPMNYEPSREKKHKKSRYIFSSDLAKLVPFYGRSRGTGHPGLVFFNRGGEPLTFDPLNKYDRSKNAFGLVLGPPGSGKSALMVYILLQFVATYRARIYIIEKGGSFKLFGDYCKHFGLSVNQVTLDQKTDVSLPPFSDAYAMLDSEKAKRTGLSADESLDKSDANEDEERDLLGEMELKARIMITGGDKAEEALLSRADRLTIRNAILQAAEKKRASNPEKIVLTEDVVEELNLLSQDESLTPKRRERAKDMADAMALYCSGIAGRFFNREGQSWPKSDVTILELGILSNTGYEDLLALGIIGLINQIVGVVEKEQYEGRPTVIVGDEAHLYMTNPLLAILFVKIAKMFRKLQTWLWLATQNLSDLPNEAGKLLNMLEWWIAMVAPKEEVEQIGRFRELTPEQKTMLLATRKEAGKYTEGVVMSDNLQCLFRNVPPTLALALPMSEGHEKKERAEIMKQQNCTELEAVFYMAKRMENKSTSN